MWINETIERKIDTMFDDRKEREKECLTTRKKERKSV